ncbi:MAG TPA: peptidoglycan DD-metalloendopeptidase family protein [Candidatus Cybelea sp.]|nr:peptidoglycan DD-metalloendopeptidase family protein [Candidatus Cybelea sp.]
MAKRISVSAVALCIGLAACNQSGRPRNVALPTDTAASAPSQSAVASYGQVTGNQYVVAPGDTLSAVAARTNTPMKSLIELNGLQPPYVLYPGMKIALKPGTSVAVSGGSETPSASPSGSITSTPLSALPAPVSAMPEPSMTAPEKAGQVGLSTAPASTAGVTATPLTSASNPPATPAPKAAATPQVASMPAAPTTSSATAAPATAAAQPTAASPAPKSSAEAEVESDVASATPDAAVQSAPAAGSGKGPFVWPVQGKVIGTFGQTKDGLKNDGINIAAPAGAPVVAAADGVVAYAGNELRGFGNMILIRHDGGFVTAYAHNDSLLVKKGDQVKRGETIARVGSTGAVFGPQLHFEIRKGTQPVDPMTYLGG